MVASFSIPFFLFHSLYIVSPLLLFIKRRPPYPPSLTVLLSFSLHPPFLRLFLFLCWSGMLALRSSVWGRPHIPPSRSVGGRRVGDVCFTQRTHTHTHVRSFTLTHLPNTAAAVVSETLVTIHQEHACCPRRSVLKARPSLSRWKQSSQLSLMKSKHFFTHYPWWRVFQNPHIPKGNFCLRMPPITTERM